MDTSKVPDVISKLEYSTLEKKKTVCFGRWQGVSLEAHSGREGCQMGRVRGGT